MAVHVPPSEMLWLAAQVTMHSGLDIVHWLLLASESPENTFSLWNICLGLLLSGPLTLQLFDVLV